MNRLDLIAKQICSNPKFSHWSLGYGVGHKNEINYETFLMYADNDYMDQRAKIAVMPKIYTPHALSGNLFFKTTILDRMRHKLTKNHIGNMLYNELMMTTGISFNMENRDESIYASADLEIGKLNFQGSLEIDTRGSNFYEYPKKILSSQIINGEMPIYVPLSIITKF